MLANWAGLQSTAEELAPLMITPAKNGTLQTDYLGAARRIGLMAITIHSLKNLLIEVSHDHPIVVLQNLGSSANPIWHYAIVHGYDLTKEELLMHSGKDKNLKYDLAQFERTWKSAGEWALSILPPGNLPETSSLDEVLSASTALERSKRNHEANLAYQSILRKWPKSLGALFGLGNSFSALKKYQQSVDAFTRASQIAPNSEAILHNLAEVKLKLKLKNKK